MKFEDIWHSIQTSLKPGVTIKNWTAAKGYIGDSFTIVGISSEAVTVDSPTAKKINSVFLAKTLKLYMKSGLHTALGLSNVRKFEKELSFQSTSLAFCITSKTKSQESTIRP